MSTTNIILDLVLIGMAIWMVATVRGVGGIVGRTLTLITAGVLVLGLAHFMATWQHTLWPITTPGAEAFIHRVTVLLGFVLLVAGFGQARQLRE